MIWVRGAGPIGNGSGARRRERVGKDADVQHGRDLDGALSQVPGFGPQIVDGGAMPLHAPFTAPYRCVELDHSEPAEQSLS
jgi:hypothetical protein